MEHPFRTHFRADDEPYSEQVVLLDGQGIWYYHPDAPQLQIPAGNKYSHLKAVPVSRTDFGLGEEWFLFFCPQSVFKMHPLFDYVFADILSRAPHAHVVVTGGRRATWTDQYISRMRAAMEPKIFERIHVIKRISSEKFLNLLRIANVLLHPFPFDGSRTSADGLGVGIPVLTLPTEYLRGRMCHAFYRTMDLPELVAQNRSDYVNIAVKLAYDSQFYQSVKQRLVDNSYLIWEDIEVPFMWSNFLTHLGGARPVNWDQFLLESGRNIAKENDLKRKREENRQNFRRRWGEETWLLRSDGVAPMISTPNKYEPPVIFADWNFGQLPEAVNMSGVIARHQMDSTASSMKKADIITSPGQEDSTTYGNLYRSDILQLLSAEGALAASNSALKLYDLCSNDSFYLLELGILHLNAGDFTGALRYCRDSLTINPHCLTCQICVGISAVANDKEDSAVNALAKAWSILKSGPLDGPSTELLLPTVDLIEYSLLEALLHFQKYDDCLDLVETFLDLPPLNAGGAVAIVFSLVNWSDDSVEKYFQKHELLRSSGAQTSHSLFGTIRRLQQNHLDILPSACRCLDHATLSDDITAVKDARAKLKAIIDEADFDFLERSRHKDDHQQSKVVLLTKYFPPEEGSNDSGNSCYVAFRDELNRALLINLNNPIIDKVALVTNREHDFTSIFGAALASKIVYVSSNSIERVIYSTIFKFVNDNFDAGSIIIFGKF